MSTLKRTALKKSAKKGNVRSATKKVTVNLPEDQVEFLLDIAAAESITFTDALRRSINSEKFFVEQEDHGRKVLIEGDDHNLVQIIRK